METVLDLVLLLQAVVGDLVMGTPLLLLDLLVGQEVVVVWEIKPVLVVQHLVLPAELLEQYLLLLGGEILVELLHPQAVVLVVVVVVLVVLDRSERNHHQLEEKVAMDFSIYLQDHQQQYNQ